MTNLDSALKSRDWLCQQGPFNKGNCLPSGHIWSRELDCKEGRELKNWCLWILVLEKTSESSLDSKEIKPVNLKGNQPWILVGRTDSESETHWKSPQCWDSLRAEGKEGIWGWDGWVKSPMQWTWTWTCFGRWWGTGRPGVLRSIEWQRVRHDWAIEQSLIRGLIHHLRCTWLELCKTIAS